jgi:hypothetical protein
MATQNSNILKPTLFRVLCKYTAQSDPLLIDSNLSSSKNKTKTEVEKKRKKRKTRTLRSDIGFGRRKGAGRVRIGGRRRGQIRLARRGRRDRVEVVRAHQLRDGVNG